MCWKLGKGVGLLTTGRRWLLTVPLGAERGQTSYFEIPSDFPLLRPWPAWWRAGTGMKLSAQRCFGDFRRSARQLNSLEASSRRWATWLMWH